MRRFAIAAVALLGPACGSVEQQDADVGGNYTVSVTNGADECQFPDWMEGQSSSNIPLAISQDGNAVVAEVGGLVGAFLDLVLGSPTFVGTVAGSSLDLTLVGEKDVTQDDCTYRVRAFVDAEIDGDVLTGTIRYTKVVDDAQPCADLDGCDTEQSFNGTRPPSR